MTIRALKNITTTVYKRMRSGENLSENDRIVLGWGGKAKKLSCAKQKQILVNLLNLIEALFECVCLVG